MKSGEQQDTGLISEILAGEKKKYAILVRKYNQRLYRICKGYLSDEADIEDAIQEAYVKAYENLAKFSGRSEFSTWLIRIMINECLARLKKMKKTTSLKDDEAMHPIDYQSPEKKSLNKELAVLLQDKIDQLPENYRIVFIMREVEKMNVAQTAEALGITASNVKARLSRAKETLRDSLLKSYPVEELYEFNLVRCDRIVDKVLSRI
jgi:RNA polymerase sigma factor (sigma-70 family)